MLKLHSTNHQKKYWRDRKINWKTDYLDTYNHPHRLWLVEQLRDLRFSSIFEVGCGPGANLVPIGIMFPRVALGGADVNPEAIALARETFGPNAFFEVASGDDLMMSDASTDITLTDMCLIYVSPREIKKYLKEVKRISRRQVVFVEFYHPSFWKRLRMTLAGRYTHNYPKLLEKLGCSDIVVRKIPEHLYPGAHDHEYRYLIMART